MNVKRSLIIRVFFTLILAFLVCATGLYVTYRIANNHRDEYYEQRKIQAATAAAAIDGDEVEQLKGNASDEETPVFKKIRSQLVRIKQTDTRIRFVYLMRPQNGKIIFLADAEDPSSPDYSPPGQVYEEAEPYYFSVFEGKAPPSTFIEPVYKDRWGTWTSAMSYVLDSKGKPAALLGTDVDVERAFASFNEIKRLGTVFDIVAVFLFAVVSAQWIAWRFNKGKNEALRRQMEESAIRLNQELLKADKMKSEFLQIATHELRGPVNAVNLAVETMDKTAKEKLNENERALLDVARNGSKRLVDLVNNLLDMTRIEAGDYSLNPKEVDIRVLVEKTVDLFEPVAREKGLDISAKLPDEPLKAVADEQALLRVLENLVGNAIKFTDYGRVTVQANSTDGKIRIMVKDTGKGVPQEFRDQLFKKFTRIQAGEGKEKKGSGLGLAICKGLVEAHGGRIWYEGEEGKGSSFIFELPKKAKVEAAR